MRINKYIAGSGVTSRRGADKLVEEGRVKVNNKTVTTLGFEVNEDNDTVTVDGRKITLVNKYTYLMLYKPKGCVCTASDEFNRKTVFDYVNVDKRLFTVGRLDYDSEGLLILTNDGALAQYLTHPSNEIPKSYLVKVEGDIPQADLAKLRKGVTLDDGARKGETQRNRGEYLFLRRHHFRGEKEGNPQNVRGDRKRGHFP